MAKAGKQGYSFAVGPPRTCGCGRRFRPSAVVESSGSGRVYTCPTCTAAEKKEKRRRKQQKED